MEVIGVGITADDGTGDPLRTAFSKCNSNFAELLSVITGTPIEDLVINFDDMTRILGSMPDTTANYDDLEDAVSTIGITPKTLWIPSDQTVSDDLTIPSTLQIVPLNGAKITIASGKTLTINSPFTAGTYQVFTGSGSVAGLKEARPEWWGGKGDGATDSTTAIQAAHDSLTTDGIIRFNSGEYLSDRVNISTSGITLQGVGYETIIERKTDTTEVLINVTNHYFKLDNLKIQESGSTLTNTGKLISLVNVSDWSVTNCWFFYGYDQLHGDVANNGVIANNVFEASRHAEIYGSQVSQTRIVGNSFFNANLDVTARTAAVYLEKKAGYSFNAAGITITGNTFYSARYGHLIHLKEIAGSSITGNTFEMAGKYDAGTKDDIYLENSDYIAVDGNSSVMVYNDYQAGVRATRYNLYLDANCTFIKIGANAFLPGSLGTINDLTTDAGTSYDLLNTAYTPVWTADGTAPDIGNGAITGRWTRSGRTIRAVISVTFGSTTTFGTSTYYFSLPKAATTTGYIGTARLRGPGATDRQLAMIDSVSGQSKVSIAHVNAAGSVTNIAPWTWANGNTIQIEVEYPI